MNIKIYVRLYLHFILLIFYYLQPAVCYIYIKKELLFTLHSVGCRGFFLRVVVRFISHHSFSFTFHFSFILYTVTENWLWKCLCKPSILQTRNASKCSPSPFLVSEKQKAVQQNMLRGAYTILCEWCEKWRDTKTRKQGILSLQKCSPLHMAAVCVL